MKVWIARDGEEIGSFPENDLQNLAAYGQLQPGDHYWYEGLEDWGQLGDFLGPEAWQPTSQPTPIRKYLRLLGIAVAAIVIICGLAAYLTQSSSTSVQLPPPVRSAPAIGPVAPDLSRTDPKIREKALASLEQLLKRLPRATTAEANTAYYSIQTVIPEPPGPLMATITGAEDTVDPITRATLWHTPFILTLKYRDPQWMYSDYRASMIDMSDGVVTEIDVHREGAIPPAIVSILGVKPVAEFALPSAIAR